MTYAKVIKQSSTKAAKIQLFMENKEMRSKLLTKEMLQEYGITNITEDGQVFRGDKAVKISISQKKGKHKLQKPYAKICISGVSPIPVHRAVYAWYHGEIPEGLEVDHIDENTLNNNLNNLRLLTKEENLARKKVSRNQYSCWKTDEEILAERESKKYIYNREMHKAVKAEWWIKELEQKRAIKAAEQAEAAKKQQLKDEWHRLNAELYAKKIERRAVHKTGDPMKWREMKWRELGEEIKALNLAITEIREKMKNGHCYNSNERGQG